MKSLIILLFILSINAHGSWVHEPTTSNFLDINTLKFSNRADCALESKKATKSIFFLLDNMNLGKVLYRISKKIHVEDHFIQEGIRRYNTTTISLAQIVMGKLLQGRLPLFNSKTPGWSESTQDCSTQSCRGLDELIEKIWNGSSYPGLKISFQTQAYPSCMFLKKFSPLEGHLTTNKPNLNFLNNLSQAVHHQDEYLSSCDNLPLEETQTRVFQIDLRHIQDEEWNKIGFEFWNSFKIYMSWAFRFSPEVKKMSGNYSSLFRQIDLEESSLVFPNGCSSIIAPECGKDFLNLSSLRTLAQVQGSKELASLSYFDGPASQPLPTLLRDQNPEMNSDLLEINEYKDASDWANNFRENFIKARGYLKLKLSNSLSMLNLIEAHLKDLLLPKNASYLEKSLINLKDEKALQEAYILCSEYKIAMDEKLSLFKKDLLKTIQERTFIEASKTFSHNAQQQVEWILNEVAPGILSLCDKLDSKNIWNQIVPFPKDLYAPWYQEIVFYIKKNEFNLKHSTNIDGKPTLYVESLSDKTICETPMHCARRLLEIMMNLKTYSHYASGFQDLGDGLKTPSLLNPMAERYACKIYDPWFKTRKTIFDLVSDLVLTAGASVIPTPIYFDLSLRQKKIMSFNEALKDGKIYYDAKFDKTKIQASLIADFGPLLNAPCHLSINNQMSSNQNHFFFEGITLQSCLESQTNTLTIQAPEDIQPNNRSSSGCLSCTINLSSALTTINSTNNPIRPLIFLLRAAVRLVRNLKDPHDIPRSWKVNPNSVYRSWRQRGMISPSCKRDLTRGQECLNKRCEENLSLTFENYFKKYIHNLEIHPGNVATFSIHNEANKWGVKLPEFGCSKKNYAKEDFFKMEASL